MPGPKTILLDTGVLGQVTHPKTEQNAPATKWLRGVILAGHTVVLPEIADYELRRSLLRIPSAKSLGRLDELADSLKYLPLTTAVMREAAGFWATARQGGYPTAPDDALDADVILAAQAASLATDGGDVIVATTNVGHLQRFVPADVWSSIS